jgi:hypothetical protein
MVLPENGFIRLPPDSTGKRSAAAARLILLCQDNTTYTFEVGQTITGQTSGATAEIVGYNIKGFVAGEIELYCDLNTLVGTFQANEDILVGATVYAKTKTAATLDQIYYQKNIIVDRDNIDRHLTIGNNGDAFVRFDEGSPSLSSFGGLIVESPETVRQYVYAYDERPDDFHDNTSGGASVSYASNERAVILDTNGNSSGALAQRTSHLYHAYQPGTMTKVMQTVLLGDTGKAGVRRRWGYFDDDNGLYWELDETTLYVVVRSNTTGSVVNTRIAQIDWNRDQLDGTVKFNIDVSKTNLYWIDFQWLGVGICRFGIYEEDGTKTTCHVFENPNNQIAAYMRQGTLPVRYECENIATAGSSSELKAICVVVQNVGKIKRQLNSHSVSSTGYDAGLGLAPERPILTVRPKQTFGGLDNHALTLISEMHVSSIGSGPYIYRIRGNCYTSGNAFTSVDSKSVSEYDIAATGFANSGTVLYSAILNAGNHYEHSFLKLSDKFQEEIYTHTLADGNLTQPEISVTIQPLLPTSTGNFYATLNLSEMVY